MAADNLSSAGSIRRRGRIERGHAGGGTMTDATGRGVSLARGSSARFVAEVTALALSFLTGILVARHLGPDGKGVVSTFGYLATLFGSLAAFGLGEATTTLMSRARLPLTEAVPAMLALVAVT